MATWGDVVAVMTGFPETAGVDGPGDPVWRVRGRFFVRHRVGDGAIAVQTGRDLREVLLARGDPPFYSTPHYDGPRGGYVLIRLPDIDPDHLADALTDAWLAIAPKRLATAWRTADGALSAGATGGPFPNRDRSAS